MKKVKIIMGSIGIGIFLLLLHIVLTCPFWIYLWLVIDFFLVGNEVSSVLELLFGFWILLIPMLISGWWLFNVDYLSWWEFKDTVNDKLFFQLQKKEINHSLEEKIFDHLQEYANKNPNTKLIYFQVFGVWFFYDFENEEYYLEYPYLTTIRRVKKIKIRITRVATYNVSAEEN